ncbi:MAG: TonB-dependent receptor [Sediminibacterium sp.]|nr:TonB-dependent receptor [Sediminibacterium sp.]TXT33955.1 MAG: TonB-dependent receptor plug [Chitinophagaceae bacterium]
MRKKLLLGLFALFCVVMGYSQTTVSGKITDAITGNPLGGVTVKGKGNPVSSISDADGKYSIKIAASIKTLVFSSVGYSDVEIPVKAGNIDVALNSAVSNLSEVIVTGFGGSQIKREVTGNIARVKGKDIEYMPTPSVDAALQGKAAGVFVNSQSGKLGQAVTVRVRGNSSISANSQPLYVLDGIPMTSNSQSSFGGATNPLTDINPNDIESIEVLKDASAGAIFGSRAANGVVLITTKKGRAGKTQVTFNYQTGAAEATKRLKMLNSEEYATLILEGAKYRDDLDGTPITDPSSWTAYVKNDVMDYYSYGNWSKDPKKSYDWQDAVFQKAPYRQADLQIRGGSDKTKFFSSFQHLQQAGTMIGNELSRTTGRLNIDQKVNDWLDMGVSLSLSRTYNKRLPDDNAFSNPLQAIALMPMTPFTDPNTGLPAGAPPGDVNIPLYYNPVLSVDYAKYTQDVYRTFGNAYFKAYLMKGLTFQTEFGMDYLSQNEEGYFQSQTVRNQTRASGGLGQNRGAFITNYNTQSFLNYSTVIKKHNITATLGTQYQQSQAKYNFTEGTAFPSNSYQKVASAATISSGSSSQTDFRFLSYFLRGNYTFDEKYIVAASARIDQSSRFGKNSRSGFFPAVSAGWIMTNEKFLQDSKIFSFLKLRASYGIVGNAEIGNFPQLGLFSGDAGYAGAAGQRPSQLRNDNLKWETTNQFDIGVDFGILKNRISGEIDYYVKKTDGLLLNVNIPATTGFNSQVRNVGKLENKGIEFVLNTQNLIGAFKWNTSLNIARNIGKVTDIQGQIIEGGVSSMNRVQEGYAVGVFYTPEFAGVDPTNGNALFYLNTKNADGSLNKGTTSNYALAQRIVAGDPNPDYILGVTNTFSYKGFDASIFFNGVLGNQNNIYGMGRYSSASMLYEDNNTADQLRRWQKPGDITDIPQVRLYRVNGSQASSRYIVDGSYIRLRTVSLGYTFNAKQLSKFKIERLRFYVSAQNLLTFTNYTYWDPEVNADSFDSNIAKGNDFYTSPQPRTILFGVNVGF